MGIVIRQSSISTTLTFIGIGIGYLNVLYFFPLYLTPSQIGLTRVIQDFAMLLVPFAQFGMGQATLKFYPAFARKNEKSNGFLTLMITLAFMGFILFLILFFILHEPITGIFANRSPEVNKYLELVLILTFILVLYNIIFDYSRSLLKIVVPNFLREVFLRLVTTISILLYFFSIVNFDGFLICIVSAYLLNLILLILYLRGKGEFRISFRFSGIVSSNEIQEILKYALFAFIGASGAVIIAKVDSVMVTSLLSTYSNGIYTTAFYMAVIIEIPRRMIAQISTPLIAQGLEKENYREVNTIYGKTALNQLIIGSLLLIGLWANLDNIYHFIPNNEIYILGKWVVLIIGLAKLVDMGAGQNGEIIVLSKYYKINILFTGILAVLLISFNLILIPRYGITGAAYGTALALIIFNICKFLYLWRKMSFQPFTKNNLKVLIIGTLVLLAAVGIPKLSEPFADLLIRSALITIVYSGLIIIFRCSEDVTGIFQKILGVIHRKK